LLLLVGLNPWQAHGEELGGHKEVSEAQKPGGSETPAVIMEPFYFFRERESGIWVERVLVHLEADGSLAAFDQDPSRYRTILQEILESQADEGQLADKALAALRQPPASLAVRGLKVSRSTLILR
jgi:hypothetical protein